MNCNSTINVTVRNKNGTSVTADDLKEFEEFWVENIEPPCARAWDVVGPNIIEYHIATDRKDIFASCGVMSEYFHSDEEFKPYALAHPHMQIEVFQYWDDGEGTTIRYLFEGDVVEGLHEIREFEQPEKIDWPD